MNLAERIARCPRKLWVGTYEVPLHFVPRSHEKLTDAEGEYDGHTELNPAVIFICESLALMTLLESVYHEITHFVDFATDIEDGAIEEEIADRHGKTWTLFWINNPKFQRWWNSACAAVREERDGKKK